MMPALDHCFMKSSTKLSRDVDVDFPRLAGCFVDQMMSADDRAIPIRKSCLEQTDEVLQQSAFFMACVVRSEMWLRGLFRAIDFPVQA